MADGLAGPSQPYGIGSGEAVVVDGVYDSDLRRGPPGRRMGLGVPEKLRGAVFFACVYRFMSWTGPGKPLTARGGCYGAVMI